MTTTPDGEDVQDTVIPPVAMPDGQDDTLITAPSVADAEESEGAAKGSSDAEDVDLACAASHSASQEGETVTEMLPNGEGETVVVSQEEEEEDPALETTGDCPSAVDVASADVETDMFQQENEIDGPVDTAEPDSKKP